MLPLLLTAALTCAGTAVADGAPTLRIESESLEAKGRAPDLAAVAPALDKYLPQLKYCHSAQMSKAGARGDGTVTLKISVAANGAVSKATAQASTLDSPKSEECMAGRAARLGTLAKTGKPYTLLWTVRTWMEPAPEPEAAEAASEASSAKESIHQDGE